MPNVTLTRTNTVPMLANTGYHLLPSGGGGFNYTFLNLGAGNLLLRFDANPTGANDPAAFTIPSGLLRTVQLYVPDGGIYALVDQAGGVSVMLGSK